MPKNGLKTKHRRWVTYLLIWSMILTLFQTAHVAYADNEDYAVVCIEKRTLGQGYLIEPTLVRIEEGDTAAHLLVRLLKNKGYEYQCTGSSDGGDFYLSSIKNADSGVLDIPTFITENGGPSNEVNDGNSDDYLGEFDYSSMSGWMITVNNEMINVGSAQWSVNDGDVIRWAFTLWGYGADLGYSTGWGNEAYYIEPDKGDLVKALATVNEQKESFIEQYAQEYEQAKNAALNYGLTQEDVDLQAERLLSAYHQFLNPANPTEPQNQVPVKELAYEIEDAMTLTSDYLLSTVTVPTCGSVGGEWAVLQLARAGMITDDFKKTYLDNLTDYIKELNGVLHSKKLTEYSRVIIALTSLGVNPENFAGYNLLLPLADFDKTVWQGINGAIYALIAFDCGNYSIPKVTGSGKQTTREELITYILNQEIEGGGWALSGKTPDPDITMMAIQGLAPYYKTNESVEAAVERGLTVISQQQRADGGLASWGTVNSESVAQTICALSALGIDPAKDSRFIKEDGSWLLSNLFSYMIPANGMISFAHTGTTSNQMATEQAGYALVAYYRLLNNMNGLYQMSDVEGGEGGEGGETPKEDLQLMNATLITPENITNVKDTRFVVPLRVGSFITDTTLIDGVIKYSPLLEVEQLTVSSSIAGGTLNYNATQDGTLRFVYTDLINGQVLTSSQTGQQDIMFITFRLNKVLQEEESLYISLQSLRQIKDSDTVIEFTDPTPIHLITTKIFHVVVTVLYEGNGSDLIPKDKKAVKVMISGLDEIVSGLGFECEGNQYSALYKSGDFTDGSKQLTYLMLVNNQVTLEQLTNPLNYYIYDSLSMDTIYFADTNQDMVIDAQDALNIVTLWLRKSESEMNSKVILINNVNADQKIDTLDALSVVEYYVKSKPFAILQK